MTSNNFYFKDYCQIYGYFVVCKSIFLKFRNFGFYSLKIKQSLDIREKYSCHATVLVVYYIEHLFMNEKGHAMRISSRHQVILNKKKGVTLFFRFIKRNVRTFVGMPGKIT